MKSILDPSFRYVPSVETDVRKTFARVRRQMRAAEPRQLELVTKPPLRFVPRRRAAGV
ncbi:MAG: hypothetical protein IT516_12295 [Burkholderiales bacterium]|nr:hypothetical protein [Burkholderiales bacterium]